MAKPIKKAQVASSKASEYQLVSSYKLGYRHREDITNMPPGVLIVGSKNVLTNVSERVQIRQGYTVDGSISTVASPTMASFDWITKNNGERNMRAGDLTIAGNDGKLQYRYVDSAGAVTWRNLITGLTSVSYNFTTFWNTIEGVRETLFVNGASQIQAWNGAIATLLSATANTITKNGTDTWLDTGFYASGNKKVIINGTEYTYTGGESTTTLTGVTPSPVAEPVNSVIHQSVVTTLNSAMTGITATFTNGLIKVMNNQIFLGSLTSSVMWLSDVNSYTDYVGSTPRQTGEGGSLVLDENLVAFNVQGDTTNPTMYVSTRNIWYKIAFTDYVSVSGSSGQTLGAIPIKTGQQQGAQSQAMVSSMKNNTIVVTNEPTIDLIGVMENFFTQIQTKNISDPIKLDMDLYDFTNGSIAYWRYYILVAVPTEGIILIYNLSTNGWEAPQTIPVTRFYIVEGELYGHSSQTFESYKLFEGYADRVYPIFSGNPIQAIWRFSYQNYGSRFTYKKANSFYTEGYINPNTTLTMNITYELDGCATTKMFSLSGSDRQVVCIPSVGGSFGNNSFGKLKLGGEEPQNELPPKFRVEKTFPSNNFFECSISYEVLGVDNRMELLAYGLNASQAQEEPINIRQ